MKGWSQEFTYVSCVSFDNQNIVSLIQIAKYSFSWMKKVFEYSFVWINLFWNIQLSDDIVAASLSRKAMGNQIRPTSPNIRRKGCKCLFLFWTFLWTATIARKEWESAHGQIPLYLPRTKDILIGNPPSWYNIKEKNISLITFNHFYRTLKEICVRYFQF